MRSTVNREASAIVLRAIRKHLTAIEDGIQSYHGDPSKFEDLDESLRRTRVAKCATSIIGSATLSRLLSLQEDVLESVAIDGCALDDDILSLLTEMVSATSSFVDAQEQLPTVGDALDVSQGGLVASLKSYRRYRRLPESDDDLAISDLFRGARNSSIHIDGPHLQSPQDNTDDAMASELSADSEEPTSDDTFQKDEIAPELLEVFQEEAEDHITQIYAGLGELQKDQGNREHIQNVRRAAHTFKGAAGAVGLRSLSKLSHRMEDVLDELYDGGTEPTPQLLSLLLETTDVLQDCLNDPDSSSVEKIPQLYAAYAALSGDGNAADLPAVESAGQSEASSAAGDDTKAAEQSKSKTSQSRSVRVPSHRLDEVRNVVSELMINRTSLEQHMEQLVSCVDELQPVLNRMRSVCHQLETKYEVPALWTTSAAGSGWAPNTDHSAWRDDREEFDELEFDRYTDFHLLTRSLAETTSDTGAISHELRTLIGDFQTLLARQTQLTREAQSRLLQIRMVPFGSVSTRLQRVLREVADRQQKSVELIIEGEQTELDKTVLEELVDPLLHLLRNSVDHGVEAADVREAKGKPSTAQVYLSAAHYGTQVVIRIRDDGKGLDPDKIRSGIIQGGYLDDEEVDALSPNELFSYIFLPGFSTASQVTEISGRGVGMDIVRSNIEKLKGSIDVESNIGVGTCFTIRLPTTLVVTRALIAKTNNETFAIPTHAVTKIRKVEPGATVQHDGKSMASVDGTVYELARFDSQFEFASFTPLADETLTVAIVQLGDRFVALSFDTILSTRDIVVKPLGNHLGDVHGLLGATVLGDGSVVPILDPAGLITCPALSESLPQIAPVPDGDFQDVAVMIVDDSVSVRRALTNLIQRADWTPITARDGADALETIGDLKTPPHVVLLDVEMPRMDGYELLGILRSKPEFEHTPIIMITSRGGEKHRRKAIELGATAYVVKPFQDEPLLLLMQRHIAQSKKLKASQ